MPLLRCAMYAKGVQIWCAPTVDERDVWQSSMRHIAHEALLRRQCAGSRRRVRSASTCRAGIRSGR